MTNTHIHVPEAPFWDRDIYGSAMHNGVPVFSKIGRGPRGYKGDKGDKGDTGAAGEDGFAPWTEFAYPDDSSYPLEPGDDHYGHPVIIVHDRDGDHWYALDPKPDPASMDDEDLAKLAGLLTNKKLWPRWVEWESSLSPTPAWWPRGDYTKVRLDGGDSGFYQICRINNATHSIQCPNFFYDPASSTDSCNIEDFVIEEAQFIRNGLDYQFVKGPGDWIEDSATSQTSSPHFFLSSDCKHLYFYPKLDSGHTLQECLLRLCLYPKYPEE